MSEHTIVVSDVSKQFKNEKVLKNVTLTCKSGQIYGIVGRNGSGKSVLLKIICGFMKPDSGKVTIDGGQVGKDIDFPENIGMVMDSPGFLWYESGLSNLLYLAGINKKIDKEAVRAAMKKVGLDPDNKKKVMKYSLGMKQRLNIAQAIMENQEILLMDEPMNGLDEKAVAFVRELLAELRSQGRLIILVSHNREDIELLCDEVYQMCDGELKRVEE